MAKILNINDRITCPRKQHLIAVAKRNVYEGDLVRTRDLYFEPGQEKVAGQKMACSSCGSVWMLQSKVHTAEGWKPSDPQLESVIQR